MHLGDLGCVPAAEQMSILDKPDLLMIPIGGFFTIDAKQAYTIADRLDARIILPMHYKTGYNHDWPIEGPESFLSLYHSDEICRDAEALRVTDRDMECHPKIVVFKQ